MLNVQSYSNYPNYSVSGQNSSYNQSFKATVINKLPKGTEKSMKEFVKYLTEVMKQVGTQADRVELGAYKGTLRVNVIPQSGKLQMLNGEDLNRYNSKYTKKNGHKDDPTAELIEKIKQILLRNKKS